MAETRAFDLLAPLPTGTTVLEASAGTGKTYAVGALVTRFVAEGHARLEEMLVITFGRAASQELRERVREQLVKAAQALADPQATLANPDTDALLRALVDVPDDELAARRSRVAAALATYDAATIATTHQFCQLVLRSLGVAGDTDTRAELVENLDDLVEEVLDDLYLARYADSPGKPALSRDAALRLARAVVEDPQATLTPEDTGGGTARERVELGRAVRAEVDRRKRMRGLLSYDDLLSRLADALEKPDSAARDRMRRRWSVVLVDEFQDTDPVQWAVLERAFHGHAAMVLIGDPKQAIYAFRGGDIDTYLAAREQAATVATLATNFRSDRPLVESLQGLIGGVELGDPRIVVHPVAAARSESRLVGAPTPAPFRLRQVYGDDLTRTDKGTVPIAAAREHIAQDLAGDIARLLDSGATYDGKPIRAGDIAILMYSLAQVELFREALRARGIASVITSGTNVMRSDGAAEWITLLEAMEQPANARRIRAVALTSFGGCTPQQLAEGGDELTDEIAERVRGWVEAFRAHGIAAVRELLTTEGLAARVLCRPDGERTLTDIDHLAQLLHDVSRRRRMGLPALLAWLRQERETSEVSTERTRRLDTDAAAVQVLTIHGSKGLQYPVVYLPLAFNRWISDRDAALLFHDETGRRCLDIGGDSAGVKRARAEDAAEELRLTYVAMTRAKSQVVAWWAPTHDSANGGLSRLLFGRSADGLRVEDRAEVPGSDEDASARLQRWAGAVAIERSEVASDAAPPAPGPEPRLTIRRLGRSIDDTWRRTSYSGLIRLAEQSGDSEPEVVGTVDEPEAEEPPTPPAAEPAGSVPSPMADLPAGAGFGSLVHGVLEHMDPQAPDLRAELVAKVVEQQQWWPLSAPAEELAEALIPMQTTPLGPLADDLRLVDLGLRDRLRELDFEIPLAGGDTRPDAAEVTLRRFAGVLRRHLPAEDPMREYADQLDSPALGGQVLRGYLSGSIDVVLRVPQDDDHRYLIVDYKTNLLGHPDTPLTAHDYRPEALAAAMLHSHYPLQALLYSVVLHRFLRWRLGETYDADRHLGGVLYLYVRGMCGPGTPVVDGVPCGVFSWHPPAAMIAELSDVLDGGGE